MDFDDLSKEQKVMVAMRKTLANVVKDTTPAPGETHALTEATVNDIRMCLGLIASREQELMEAMGKENKFKPQYVDEKKSSEAQVIAFHKPNKD